MNDFFKSAIGGLIPALINGGVARYQNRGLLGKNAVIPEDMARSAATMGVDPQQMFAQAQKDARAGGFMGAFTGQNASQGMRGGFDQGMNRMAANEKSRLGLSNAYLGNADAVNDMGNRYAMGDRQAPPPLFRPPGLGGGGGGGGSPMFQPQGDGGGGSIPQQMAMPGGPGGAPPYGGGGLSGVQQQLVQSMQGPQGMTGGAGPPGPPGQMDEMSRRRRMMAGGGGFAGFDSPTGNGAPSVGGASPDGAPELPIDPLDPMEKVFAEDPYARRAVATNPALFQKMVENRMEERYGASKRSMTMWEAIHKAQSRDPDVAAEGKAELDEFVKYTGLGERAKDKTPEQIQNEALSTAEVPNYVKWVDESLTKAEATGKLAYSMNEAAAAMGDNQMAPFMQTFGKALANVGLLSKDGRESLASGLQGNALAMSLLGDIRKNGPADATYSERDALDNQQQLAKLEDTPETRRLIVAQLQRAAVRAGTFATLISRGPQTPNEGPIVRDMLRELKYVHNADDLQEINATAESGDWDGAMRMLHERAAPDRQLFTGLKPTPYRSLAELATARKRGATSAAPAAAPARAPAVAPPDATQQGEPPPLPRGVSRSPVNRFPVPANAAELEAQARTGGAAGEAAARQATAQAAAQEEEDAQMRAGGSIFPAQGVKAAPDQGAPPPIDPAVEDFTVKPMTGAERAIQQATKEVQSGYQGIREAMQRRRDAAEKERKEKEAAAKKEGASLTPQGNAYDLFSRRLPGQPTPEDERIARLMGFDRSYMNPMFAMPQRRRV